MSGLTTKIQLQVQANLTNSLDLADAIANLNKSYTEALVFGTGAGQADKVFHDTRTIAPSSNDDLDLNGVLLDPLGSTFNLLRVKTLIVRAAEANVNNVVVGAAAANQWATLLNAAGTVQLRPGAMLMATAGSLIQGGAMDATGYAVTPATGDILRIANGGAGTSVNYDIIIIGCSA